MSVLNNASYQLFLFQIHNIPFNTQPTEPNGTEENTDEDGAKAVLKCPISIQKETPTGLVDTICQNDVAINNAGLCRYVCFHCL